ncbi:MAG: DUF488 domain-containing protein [Nitrospirae bacterium]|nr:MAG: DUF488 domain-containing protein [Nitrospirota bacterium]
MGQCPFVFSRLRLPLSMRIYTIGHSNRSKDEFLQLLNRHAITALVDVRRFPGSRKWPHYNRQVLAECLHQHGIDYHWMEALGGRRSRKDPNVAPFLDEAIIGGLEQEAFRTYAAYMQSDMFRQALEALIVRGQSQPVVIMCAERLWWQCHRRLISDVLVASGVEVWHIVTNREPQPHVLTNVAHIAGKRVTFPPPMFAS